MVTSAERLDRLKAHSSVPYQRMSRLPSEAGILCLADWLNFSWQSSYADRVRKSEVQRSEMQRAHKGAGILALSVGFVVALLLWEAAEAFLRDWIASLGIFSVWFYCLLFLTAWSATVAVSYSVIVHLGGKTQAPDSNQTAAILPAAAGTKQASGLSPRVDPNVQDRLTALMAGFAVTALTWLFVLCFAPGEWLDAAATTSPLVALGASLALWTASTQIIYRGIRRGR